MTTVSAKTLRIKAGKLTKVSDRYQDRLAQVMSLVQLMDNSPSDGIPRLLMEELTTSMKTHTQSDKAFFLLRNSTIHTSHFVSTAANSGIEIELEKTWNTLCVMKEPFINRIGDEWYGMEVIRTATYIGILGVKIPDSSGAREVFIRERPLFSLCETSELLLERVHVNQVANQLLLYEEQNRIADEIHDSVSQRLFGLVYFLHNLQVKGEKMTSMELSEEYQFLSQSANTAIKELRSAIFRLSPKKNGDKPLVDRLTIYLEEYARLHDIQIDYELAGDETLLSTDLKQFLYRIACEACGNAVRHGQCTVITLRLAILDDKTVLEIEDNGVGIQLQKNDGQQEKGIGLSNMQRIVQSFQGTFSIGGLSGLGTAVHIEIPATTILKKEQVIG